mmetsp:Transcript_23314/g.66851  ORF Transcript_23314/g.66851 Transcript_23314/m.66851 type:complete len:271 (+) Transcript_23314:136-948(+)
MVSFQSLDKGIGSVVLTLHQGLASFVILHGLHNGLSIRSKLHGLGRSVLDVIRASRILVDPSTSDAFFKNRVWDLQLNDLGDTGTFSSQHLIQSLSLGQSTREPIQNESELAVFFLNSVANDANDNFVTHQSTGLHNGLGLLSDFSSSRDGGAKHISSRKLRDSQHILDSGSVGTLSSSRGSEKNHNVSRPVGAEFFLRFLNSLFDLVSSKQVVGFVLSLLQSGNSHRQTSSDHQSLTGIVALGSSGSSRRESTTGSSGSHSAASHSKSR